MNTPRAFRRQQEWEKPFECIRLDSMVSDSEYPLELILSQLLNCYCRHFSRSTLLCGMARKPFCPIGDGLVPNQIISFAALELRPQFLMARQDSPDKNPHLGLQRQTSRICSWTAQIPGEVSHGRFMKTWSVLGSWWKGWRLKMSPRVERAQVCTDHCTYHEFQSMLEKVLCCTGVRDSKMGLKIDSIDCKTFSSFSNVCPWVPRNTFWGKDSTEAKQINKH